MVIKCVSAYWVVVSHREGLSSRELLGGVDAPKDASAFRLMLLVIRLVRSAFNFLGLSEQCLWSQQSTHDIFLRASKALLENTALSMLGTCPLPALN